MLECLEVLVKLIGENKKAMLHIYCSVQRETFTSVLDKMCQYVIKQYIVHNFKEEIMEKEDMKVLMHFYKCVMIGVILDWMDHRMSYDLTEYAEKLRELYENTFEKTLEKAAGICKSAFFLGKWKCGKLLGKYGIVSEFQTQSFFCPFLFEIYLTIINP